MARINFFESIPTLQDITARELHGMGTLMINGVQLEGSLSFNNLAMIFSGSGGLSEDLSVSFGLYSLNGNTLSLANSASAATALTLNQTAFSWLTFATSAVQDITPGNWYFAVMSSTSLGASFSLEVENALLGMGGVYAGPFVRGMLSVSTNALPASIATSDMLKEGTLTTGQNFRQPYILISA